MCTHACVHVGVCRCVCVCVRVRTVGAPRGLSPSLKLEPLNLPAHNCHKNVAAGAELKLIWL